jgi:glucose-1-phosphate cytidylyltransferase
MKVVLFCGGQGMRMREASDVVPKPMIPVGGRPILWHVMKYYAHFGHTDFVLCLGHRGEAIKQYFLSYNEALANDFVLSNGGGQVELLKTDIHDWRISFVDTGLRASVGERLLAVRRHLEGEEYFLANYGDVVTDAHLPGLIARARAEDVSASFLCVRPTSTFHVVSMDRYGRVQALRDVVGADLWINGGYFVLRADVFDYLLPGDDLVEGPFRRLAERGRLLAQRHEGFWAPMDTLKERQQLDMLCESGKAPWRVWDPARQAAEAHDVALAAP